ncbi:MAG: LD-carboxypeptidase [Spirochaetes bacterium]|nr:LD-carboxypeptidase [Spirochaetota bacterium]
MRESDTSVVKPPCLTEGDTIGVVAPAWSFETDRFMEGVRKLESLGFRVKYDPSIFSKYWSMAGMDKGRAEQINAMFGDSEVKAIFCANAGYGSIRTLPYLDRRVIRKNPKIFVGYSDITILLSYLRTVARMVVFHGPVVSGEIHEGMNKEALEFLLSSLQNTSTYGEIEANSCRTLRPGRVSGVLLGGNLSMLISSIGTPYEIDTRNKILFLEDINETLETIDNHFMQLKLAGKLKQIKGLLLGQMIGCRDTSGRNFTIADVIDDVFGNREIPVLLGFPSGHQNDDGLNITLPFGIDVTLDAGSKMLVFHGSGVSRVESIPGRVKRSMKK